MRPMFCNITVQEKFGGNDYRSFLLWRDLDTKQLYEIRGYSGTSPGDAADTAYQKFLDEEDRDWFSEEVWEPPETKTSVTKETGRGCDEYYI